MALSAGDAVRVRKLRYDGSERIHWPGVVLRVDPSGVVVRAELAFEKVDLGFTTWYRGDVFHEFYDWDCWYTVAQIAAPDGALRGWYGDVCMPPRLSPPVDDSVAAEISYVDLVLDVWRGANGRVELMDEDEFAERRNAGQLTAEQVAGAERGWAELRAVAERGTLPHWP